MEGVCEHCGGCVLSLLFLTDGYEVGELEVSMSEVLADGLDVIGQRTSTTMERMM